jgi:hypothetical protein
VSPELFKHRITGRAVRRDRWLSARHGANSLNRVWAAAGTPVPQEVHLAAEMDQARAAKREADARTFFAPMYAWWAGSIDPDTHARYAPYAVLFLEWEDRYPQEWREAGT